MLLKKRFSILLIFFFIGGMIFSQNRTIDSLKNVLKFSKEDTLKTYILNSLSYEYSFIGNHENAYNCANQALILSKKLAYIKGEAESLYFIGRSFYFKDNYPTALYYFLKSLKLYEKTTDYLYRANCLQIIGSIYFQEKNYSTSLNYYQKSLEIFKSLGDTFSIANNLGNIGNIYDAEDKKQLALTFYLSNKKLLEQSKGDKSPSYGHILGTIGSLYSNEGEYDSALYYYSKSIEINKGLSDKYRLAYNYLNIAEVYMELKNYTKSEQYLREALPIASDINSLAAISAIDKRFSELFAKQNKWEQSLDYYKQHIIFKDSIFNETKSKQIAEMQTKYETKEKEEKINFLNQKDELNQSKIKREEQIKYLISLLFVFILIIGYLFYRNYNRKQFLLFEKTKILHENERIKAEKEIIELEQKMLLLQMNPHFIFNSLNSIKSFIMQNKSENALEYLEDFAQLMRLILSASRKEMIKLDIELKLLSYYLKLEQVRMNFAFDFKFQLSEEVEDNKELISIPPMFIQPFIENAIHHGLSNLNEKGLIEVIISTTDDALKITITDNGIGRENAALLKHTKAKNHESLAIKIMDDRIKVFQSKFNKTITFITEDLNPETKNPGTKITLNIPILSNG